MDMGQKHFLTGQLLTFAPFAPSQE